jgi:diguanylate cyclase (GGDEF)-like protein
VQICPVIAALHVKALTLSTDREFDRLIPLAQWSLLESAFRDLGAPGLSSFVPTIYIMAIEVMTGRVWCLAWLLAVAAGFPLGRWAASQFENRAEGKSPDFWAHRYTLAVWCQSALLAAGGFGAACDRTPITCVLVACPIGFAILQTCATAMLKRTAWAQALILVAPFSVTCLLLGALSQLTMFYAGAAGAACLWTLGAMPLADAAAVRMAMLTMNLAERQRSHAGRSGRSPLAPAAEDFQRLLGRDQVTGLPNRQSFMQLLAEESERACASGAPLSLLLVTWDEFEAFEAQRSKYALDEMRVRIARRLRTALRRQPDRLASLGDGRFAVLLPATDAFGVSIVARNLQQAANTQEHDDSSFAASTTVPLSIGAATYCGKGFLPENQLLQFAEEALRNAKCTGGNKIMRYDLAAKTVRPPPYVGPPPKESTPYSIPEHQIEAQNVRADGDPNVTGPEQQVITKIALGLELRH